MPRVILTFEGQRIVLPVGETLIGRSLDCRVRFNDPAISRHQLRITATADGAFAENLSRTNASRLGGEPLVGVRRLADGDRLGIGYRVLTVNLAHETLELPRVRGPAREAAPGLLVDDDPAPDDDTRPGHTEAPPRPSVAELLADASFGDERNCPKCRARVSAYSDECPTCGYERPFGLPGSRTLEIDVEAFSRRAHPRFPVVLPVVYASEFLVIDGVARDLSAGGMFVASELLDPVGTDCQVTVLPDGYGALRFSAVVCHVSTEPVDGRPAGFGVQFSDCDPEAREWLERTLAKAAESP